MKEINQKGFTLKDIKGAKKRKRSGDVGIVSEPFGSGYNAAIDAQSSVRLRLNREKVAMVLLEKREEIIRATGWPADCKQLADALIDAGADILEVVKD